jgi:hypothetical protein
LLAACSGDLGATGGADSGTPVSDGAMLADLSFDGPRPDSSVTFDGGLYDGGPVDVGTTDLGVYMDSCAAGENTFYFSSTDGDDSRSESEARNPSTPWRTITKLNSIESSLAAGACVLFRRGETFTGSISISASGNDGSPITIGAYGTGPRPIVNGFATVSEWSSLGGNIWESADEVSTVADLNMVAVGGNNTPVGRMPKTGYWPITDATHDSVSDAEHINAATENWTGAEVVVRQVRWVLDRFQITSSAGDTLSFSSSSSYDPEAGWGYFIQKDARTLTEQNDWYYNPTSHHLRMFSAGEPSNVRVATLEVGASVEGAQHVVFDNVSFVGFNNAGVDTNANAFITVQNCEFGYIGRDGIYAYPNSPNLVVTASQFSEINSTAILAASSDDALISGNTLYNIGNIPGMGASGDGGYEGIVANGNHGEIAYNTIRNVGYVGIKWDGEGTIVRNNFVDTTGYIKDDGGAIYTYPSQAQESYAEQRVVRDNIVINMIGAGAGSPSPDTSEAHGIYNDGTSANVDYINNTIAHGQLGLFLNGAHESTSTGNTIYDCARGLYLLKYNTVEISNISLQNNILVARTASQYSAYFEPMSESMPASFSSDHNVFARPINDRSGMPTVWMDQNGENVYMTVAEWSAHTGQDAASSISPVTAASEGDIRFEYNGTAASRDIALDGNYVDMMNTPRSGTISLGAYQSIVLVRVP